MHERTDDAPAPLRLFVGGAQPLGPAAEFDLPAAAAAHVKVRRLQPGAVLRLFDGDSGLDWAASVQAISRGAVRVRVVGDAALAAPARELPLAVTLAFVMPANERVDGLVEKATELGATALVPLTSERSVLRLEGERAQRRRAHWQAVAAAACEQSGRARVPRLHAVQPLGSWLASVREGTGARQTTARWLLSTAADTAALAALWRDRAAALPAAVVFLSGPEGGFSAAEGDDARRAGFVPASLGASTLRADTAPLAALGWLAVTLAAAAR